MNKKAISAFVSATLIVMLFNTAFAALNFESKRVSNKLAVSFKIGKVTDLVSVTWGDNTTDSKSFDVEEGEEKSVSIKATPKKLQQNIALVLQISGVSDVEVVIPSSIKVGTNTYILQQYEELSSLQQKDFTVKFINEGDYTLNVYAIRLGAQGIKTIWLADGNYSEGFDITRDGVILSALNKGMANISSSIKISAQNVTVDGLNITQTLVNNIPVGIYLTGDDAKIKNCYITGKSNSSSENNSGVLVSENTKIDLSIENTEFKDIYRGINLNGSSEYEGISLTASNNKFTNVSYGVINTEKCKFGVVTGNQFINCTEAFGLKSGVNSTVQGVSDLVKLKDYLLTNNTFNNVVKHVVDPIGTVYNKTN